MVGFHHLIMDIFKTKDDRIWVNYSSTQANINISSAQIFHPSVIVFYSYWSHIYRHDSCLVVLAELMMTWRLEPHLFGWTLVFEIWIITIMFQTHDSTSCWLSRSSSLPTIRICVFSLSQEKKLFMPRNYWYPK